MFDGNKNKLTKKIAKVQFVLHDLSLYLDTHPRDAQAMRHYEFYHNKLSELNLEYERLYGAPKAFREGAWTWVDGPWPWEREANAD